MLLPCLLLASAAPNPSLGLVLVAPEELQQEGQRARAAAEALLLAETTLALVPFDPFAESAGARSARGCATDPGCFAALFQRSGRTVELLLALSLASVGPRRLLAGRLFAAAEARELGALARELERPEALQAELGALLAGLLRERWGQVATLVIESQPPGAAARLGERSCLTPCTIHRLTPGPAVVELSLAGHQPARRDLALARGTARLSFSLAAEAPPPGVLESPWLWLGVGVAIAAGATAVWWAARGSGPDVVCVSGRPEEECGR